MKRVLGEGIIFDFVLGLFYTVFVGLIAICVLSNYGIYRLCRCISEQDRKQLEQESTISRKVTELPVEIIQDTTRHTNFNYHWL